jgi:hypothetical protein
MLLIILFIINICLSFPYPVAGNRKVLSCKGGSDGSRQYVFCDVFFGPRVSASKVELLHQTLTSYVEIQFQMAGRIRAAREANVRDGTRCKARDYIYRRDRLSVHGTVRIMS